MPNNPETDPADSGDYSNPRVARKARKAKPTSNKDGKASVLDFGAFSASSYGPWTRNLAAGITDLYAVEYRMSLTGTVGSDLITEYTNRVAPHVETAYNKASSESALFLASDQLLYLETILEAYIAAVAVLNTQRHLIENSDSFPDLHRLYKPELGIGSIGEALDNLIVTLAGHYLPRGLKTMVDYLYARRKIDNDEYILVQAPSANIAVDPVVAQLNALATNLSTGSILAQREKWRRAYKFGVGEDRMEIVVEPKTLPYDIKFQDILATRFWKNGGISAYPTVATGTDEFTVYATTPKMTKLQAALTTVEVGAPGSGQEQGFNLNTADNGFYNFAGGVAFVDNDLTKSQYGMWNFESTGVPAAVLPFFSKPLYQFDITYSRLKEAHIHALIDMMSFSDFGMGHLTQRVKRYYSA